MDYCRMIAVDASTPPSGPLTPQPLPRDEIRSIAAELLRRAETAAVGAPRHPGEVAAAWLLEHTAANTRAAYATDLARFMVWCARRPVSVFEVRRDHLAAYLAEPKPDGAPFAPTTQERRLAAISGMYAYALELGLITRHPRGTRPLPAARAHQPQRAAALSKAELERLVHAAREHSPNALSIVYLLGLYGLRVSEVCDARIEEQLSWDHGQPVLRVAGKGRAASETVTFPLPHDILIALEASRGDRLRGPLLIKKTGRPYVRQEIAALLITLCRRATITTRLSPHGLRATFVTLALAEGAKLRDVQDAARHADPRTTRAYDRDANALSRHPVHRLISLVAD